MENEQDNLESLNQDGEVDAEISAEESETSTDEANAELDKAKKYAQNQKIRAEKAEQELKKLKSAPSEKETPKNEMSLKDIRALADIPDEDVDDVIDYAKYKSISIADAKKSSAMQAILKAKAEERASAQAANTGGGKRGSGEVSGDSLLEKYAKGEELSDSEMEKAAQARIEAKRRRNK